MSFGHAEVGRIAGIPVLIDASFIFLIALWGFHYFTSGNLESILYGLWVVGGVALSILVHELAHAFAARAYRLRTLHVELNGLGGLCTYVGNAPHATARALIALAGPASNLLLYALLKAASIGMESLPNATYELSAISRFSLLAEHLAQINLMLFWFNLLPSHPLDGGTALAAVLGTQIGYDRAGRLVGYLGMAVCACLMLAAIGGGLFLAFLGLYLYMSNQEALERHGGPSWTRWS